MRFEEKLAYCIKCEKVYGIYRERDHEGKYYTVHEPYSHMPSYGKRREICMYCIKGIHRRKRTHQLSGSY